MDIFLIFNFQKVTILGFSSAEGSVLRFLFSLLFLVLFHPSDYVLQIAINLTEEMNLYRNRRLFFFSSACIDIFHLILKCFKIEEKNYVLSMKSHIFMFNIFFNILFTDFRNSPKWCPMAFITPNKKQFFSFFFSSFFSYTQIYLNV